MKNKDLSHNNKSKAKKSNFFMRLLDGSFLTNDWTVRQMPFIFYLVFLALLYITNVITAEKKHRQVKRLESEISSLSAKSSSINSKLSEQTKQTVIVERLRDLGLKESTEPLITIER